MEEIEIAVEGCCPQCGFNGAFDLVDARPVMLDCEQATIECPQCGTQTRDLIGDGCPDYMDDPED